jgi:hypothetical protein
MYFGVEFYTENEIPVPKEGARNKQNRLWLQVLQSLDLWFISPSINEGMKPPADMIGKAGTVPLAVPMSFIHQHVPAAPSTQRTNAGTAAVDLKRRAPLYSGTLPYIPQRSCQYISKPVSRYL